jgi:hypothetical protein
VQSTFQNAQSLKGLHPKMLKAPRLPDVDNGYARGMVGDLEWVVKLKENGRALTYPSSAETAPIRLHYRQLQTAAHASDEKGD